MGSLKQIRIKKISKKHNVEVFSISRVSFINLNFDNEENMRIFFVLLKELIDNLQLKPFERMQIEAEVMRNEFMLFIRGESVVNGVVFPKIWVRVWSSNNSNIFTSQSITLRAYAIFNGLNVSTAIKPNS